MRKLFCLFFSLTVLLTACSSENILNVETYTPYVSAITSAECFVCGEHTDPLTAQYWNGDNVGILNLNTFEMLCIGINRYDGQETLTGVLVSERMQCGASYVHAWTDPDRGYSHVQIQGKRQSIDTETIQNHLCQDCLDTFNKMYFDDDLPEEYAIINFSDKTIHPLIKNTPFFTTANYGIDCEFKENGNIDLFIVYCPPR